ncbi:MAG: PE family protein, partial [Mycobacteriaceae bacterium]|nr:PE family protein [Mycobacteriaceae bacterium]
MSLLRVTPELLSTAAADLSRVASAIEAANATAITPIGTLLPAAGDEVSAAAAALFSSYGAAYQHANARTAAFHSAFVRQLTAAAASYASAEADAGQNMVNIINAPAQALLGRPLIGNGSNGAPGTGQNGGPGGILIGNGGTGGSGALGQNGGDGGAA